MLQGRADRAEKRNADLASGMNIDEFRAALGNQSQAEISCNLANSAEDTENTVRVYRESYSRPVRLSDFQNHLEPQILSASFYTNVKGNVEQSVYRVYDSETAGHSESHP